MRAPARELREPLCNYPEHRGSEWAQPGAEEWTCGICHPPATGMDGKIQRVAA